MVTKEFVLSHIGTPHGWQGRAIFGTSQVAEGPVMMVVARNQVKPDTNILEPPFTESIPVTELVETDFT